MLTLNKKTSTFAATFIAVISLLAAAPAQAAKDFKGNQPSPDMSLGVVTGAGLVGGFGGIGLPLHLTFSKRILPQGFIEDINNSAHLEFEVGALVSALTGFYFAGHMRWDFVKDDKLTFFSFGGLSALVIPTTIFSAFSFGPRFGIGLHYKVASNVALRAQAAHDLIGGGVVFNLN